MLFAVFTWLLAAMPGQVEVPDGATLVMRGTEVRLDGIAVAPPDSLAGAAARDALAAQVADSVVSCRVEGSMDAPGASGDCAVSGADLADWLVASGHARRCGAEGSAEIGGLLGRAQPGGACRGLRP